MGAVITSKKTSKGNKIKSYKTAKSTRRGVSSLKRGFVILTKEDVERDRSSAYAYVVTA